MTKCITDDELFNIVQDMARPHLCHECRKVTIYHFGVCEKCAERHEKIQRQAVERYRPFDPKVDLPPDMRWSSFDSKLFGKRVKDSSAIKSAMKAASQLRTSDPKSTFFVGPTGAGKTSLAAAIMHEIAGAKIARTAFWIKAVELGRIRRDSPLGSEPVGIERARKASLLVLDDLGGECNMGIEVISEVVHHRRDECLPSIFTTWATDDQLKARYGEGVGRRIIEFSEKIVVRAMP